MEQREFSEQERASGTTADMGTKNTALYANNPAMTSLVSYPHRCQLWGNAGYRGNCDGTLFKDLVLRYRARCVADPMMGSGTTQHVIAGLNEHRGLGIEYWGGDLRTGFNLLKEPLPGKFDFVWIHPPYWNIIRYSDLADDLSGIEDYNLFLLMLKLCLYRCFAALLPGGRVAVLVGDIRRRGAYFPLGRDVMNMDGLLGNLVSVVIKAQHNCQSDGKAYGRMADVPIQHEYCLVFKRPEDAERAKDSSSPPRTVQAKGFTRSGPHRSADE